MAVSERDCHRRPRSLRPGQQVVGLRRRTRTSRTSQTTCRPRPLLRYFRPQAPPYTLESVDLTSDCDIAVVVTDHPRVAYAAIVTAAPASLDVRGVTRSLEAAGLGQL